MATSLRIKLLEAQAAIEAGDFDGAMKILGALMNQLEAQAGQGIADETVTELWNGVCQLLDAAALGADLQDRREPDGDGMEKNDFFLGDLVDRKNGRQMLDKPKGQTGITNTFGHCSSSVSRGNGESSPEGVGGGL